VNRWQVTCWIQHSADVVLLPFELTQHIVITHDNMPYATCAGDAVMA
jgi:hypothetical protein